MKRSLMLALLVIVAIFAFAACDQGNSNTTYTITWVDENGQTLKSQTVTEGEKPNYSYNIQDTAEWDYTVIGWSATAGGEALSEIPAAHSDVTYYALVKATKQVYTVTFTTRGGSSVASQTVEFGNKASVPENPTYEGHRFVGWSTSATEVVEVDFESPITKNVEYFAVWNEIVDVKALLVALLNGYRLNPYSYIPDSMKIDYSANFVNAENIITDYSNTVKISDIVYGFGEQWYTVLENIEQSKLFFEVLSVIETLSTTSVTAFNNYIDQNPADTAHYNFKDGIYSIVIKVDSQDIFYVVEYTANIPQFGKVTAQIALSMDIGSGDRTVRVQLGDSNALSYTLGDNYYEFAIKYLDVRTAMFKIMQNDDGSVSGAIYEFLAESDSSLLSSMANFYITDDYVSVVGNKADGIIGFDNTICELYDTSSGKMIGYEINEVKKISGVGADFDTLWFNLDRMDGLTSIKYIPKTDEADAKLYINGSKDVWKTKNVGGISLTTLSRRFDIEFRTQYVVSYDASKEEYKVHKIQVPMIFVQEEYYDTLSDDIKSENKNLEVKSEVDSDDLEKLLSDYDELVALFKENKCIHTKSFILDYIGEKITV